MRYRYCNIFKVICVNVLFISVMLLADTSIVNSAPPDAETCAFLKQFHGHV